MRTSKVNFIYLLGLTLFSFTNLNAHDCYYTNEYKSKSYMEITNFKVGSLLVKSEAIYTALKEGDVCAINAQMNATIDWNGKSGFPYPLGDPHFNPNGLAEVLFSKVNQNWTSWEVYDLKFEETVKNTITVKGYYKATQADTVMEVPFIHVWTWEGDHISKFQHFETSQPIAEER